MATNSLTELEAVNLILASADMMPVTQLTPSTTAEATLAISLSRMTVRAHSRIAFIMD